MTELAQEIMTSALETVPDGLVIVDDSGNPSYINDTARDMLKINAGQALSQAELYRLLSFDPLGFENKTQRESLIHDVLYHVYISPIYENSRRDATAVYLRDISVLNEAEAIKTDFVSIASHELRNPLTSVKNALNILLKMNETEMLEHKDRFLGIASRNVDRIANLISQYLDITKIETGRMPFDFERLVVSDFLATIAADSQERLQQAGISLSIALADDLPPALADVSKLEQVVVNLLDNAIKFTPSGGSICLSAAQVTPLAYVGGQGSYPMIRMCVADTGCGIPAEKKRYVFEKFYRVERAMEIGKEGVGLGLAIVKKLIELHGGDIWVEDNRPSGSRFCLTVPVYAGERRDPAFRWIFGRELTRARRNLHSLALMFVVPADLEAVRSRAGDDGVLQAMRVVEDAIRKNLFRQTDVVFRRKDRDMFVVFCESSKEGAHAIGRRISEKVCGALRECGSPYGELTVKIGCAVYPEDADNQRDLFRIALRTSAEEQNG